MVSFLKRAWNSWPNWFTAGVAIYFLATALGLTTHAPSLRNSTIAELEQTTTSTTATPSSESSRSTGANGLEFKITSFHVRPKSSGRDIYAMVTMEVKNPTSQAVEFRPADMGIGVPGGNAGAAVVTSTAKTSIPGKATRVIPVEFPLSAAVSGTYQLTYLGTPVYTGVPDRINLGL